MESQMKLNEERLQLFEKCRQIVPDFMAAEFGVLNLAYKDGALRSEASPL